MLLFIQQECHLTGAVTGGVTSQPVGLASSWYNNDNINITIYHHVTGNVTGDVTGTYTGFDAKFQCEKVLLKFAANFTESETPPRGADFSH